LKFKAVAEKTAKDSKGLLYFAAPCTREIGWNAVIKFSHSINEMCSMRSTLTIRTVCLFSWVYR